ncbi:hypothetical protein Tco_0674141 [Tanacetum coccineum]
MMWARVLRQYCYHEFPRVVFSEGIVSIMQQYSHVVDTFIPTKRSKNGRRFGFVRFITSSDEEDWSITYESKSVNFVNLSDHKAEEANKDGHGNCVNKNSKEDVSSSVCSGHFKKSGVPRTGGSILNLMDELVKVGQVMGYKMDGCLAQKAKKDWVKELCVKNKVNFMALQETKMENIVILSSISERQMLWDYLTYEIGKWKGEVVIIGDFNEVHYKSNRFGSVFNVQGANVFNSFITNAGLEEYTCPNINAIYDGEIALSDHRPKLLQKLLLDYGPTPFNIIHYLELMEGFNQEWKTLGGQAL